MGWSPRASLPTGKTVPQPAPQPSGAVVPAEAEEPSRSWLTAADGTVSRVAPSSNGASSRPLATHRVRTDEAGDRQPRPAWLASSPASRCVRGRAHGPATVRQRDGGAARVRRGSGPESPLRRGRVGIHDTETDRRRHRPPRTQTTSRGDRVHRPSSLTAHETRTRHGLRVTSPKRTLTDLARTLSLDDLDRVVAEAHAKRLLPDFEEHEMPPRLKQVLDGGPKLTKSDAERLLLSSSSEPGSHHPRRTSSSPAARSTRSGASSGSPWRSTAGASTATAERSSATGRRDARLRAQGVLPVRVTARQLVERPEAVVADLARAVAAQGWATASRG